MNKYLVLKNGLVRFDPSGAFVLSDDKLIITLRGFPMIRSGREAYYISFENGNGEKRTYCVRNEQNLLTLDALFLVPGELSGQVEQRTGDIVIRHWEISPLQVVTVDSSVRIMDIVQEMKDEIKRLKGEQEKIIQDVASLMKQFQLLEGGYDPLRV